MKTIIISVSIIITAGLAFVNLYTSLIDATSWGSNIPSSIATAREYYKTVNPGNFFRIFSPINQIFGILVLIFFWKNPSIRWYLGAACVLYISAEALTFAYFYPRNTIMFETAQLTDIGLLKRTWSEWNTMNWLRTFLLVLGLFFSFLSLHKFYSLQLK
jgi:hypothetical protein